jgi:hypothetical protein
MTYDVGDTAKLTLTVDPFDLTTAAAIELFAPDGTSSPVAPTTADGGATWTADVTLSSPGQWRAKWTITGTGQGVSWDTLDVDPVPPPSDAQRQVRLLISDTDTANRIFSTLELADFLSLNGDSVRRAAAQALDTLAANEAMVSKKIRTQDLQTDGPAVAEALRKQAAELRRQADQGEGDAESTGFEIVEYEPYPCRSDWPY